MYYLVQEIGVVRRGRWFNFRRNEVKKVVSIKDASRAMAEGRAARPILAGGRIPPDATRYAGCSRWQTSNRDLRGDSTLPAPRHPETRSRNTAGSSFGGPRQESAITARTWAAVNLTPFLNPSRIRRPSLWVYLSGRRTAKLGLMLYDVFDPRERVSGRPVRPGPCFFERTSETPGWSATRNGFRSFGGRSPHDPASSPRVCGG